MISYLPPLLLPHSLFDTNRTSPYPDPQRRSIPQSPPKRSIQVPPRMPLLVSHEMRYSRVIQAGWEVYIRIRQGAGGMDCMSTEIYQGRGGQGRIGRV